MAQLRQDHNKFVEKDVEIIIIAPEGAEEIDKYWTKHNLPYLGLPDPQHTVLNQYGQQFKILRLGRMPAQAIIDKSGIIRYLHYGKSMQDIPHNNDMLELVSTL